MLNYSLKKRLRYYILLAVLIIAVPVVVLLGSIIFTGSVGHGLGMAVIPSLFGIHFIFGLLYFKPYTNAKYAAGILSIIPGAAMFWPAVTWGATPWFWLSLITAYFTYLLLSIILWETLYHCIAVIKRVREIRQTL